MGKKVKHKHLCKYDKKEIGDSLELLASLIIQPLFLCEKCARAANTDAVLCKPIRF
jgi:hypothetical protein